MEEYKNEIHTDYYFVDNDTCFVLFHHHNYTIKDLDIMDITQKMYLHHVF